MADAAPSLAEQLRSRLRELAQSTSIPPIQQKPVVRSVDDDGLDEPVAPADRPQERYGDMEPERMIEPVTSETEAQRYERIYHDHTAWTGGIGKYD